MAVALSGTHRSKYQTRTAKMFGYVTAVPYWFVVKHSQSCCGRVLVASTRGKQAGLSTASAGKEFIPPPPPPPSSFVLYNSLSQQKDTVQFPSKARGIACYCCGPTVYDDAHLGHARMYVWFDMFRRILEQHAASCNAIPPLFVMNITDVDDKILKASSEKSPHISPLDYAKDFERKFWRDMDGLNCLRPHVVVRVSEHVESGIIPYIQTLIDKGMAYETLGNSSSTAGGVLFDVAAFEDAEQTYGKLVPNLPSSSTYDLHLEDAHDDGILQPAVGLQKKDPRDFALWKRKKPQEVLFWDSPWGAGRPGWHIECSAMIESVQKQFPSYEFMIHAGGIDLKFPHHTNEIAQAEAFHHCCPGSKLGTAKEEQRNEWIPHWMHMGHLHIGGRKMSKSLKNFITIESRLKQNSEWADNFRLWCLALSGNYRDATTYSEDRIEESRNTRAKLVRFLVTAETWIRHQKDFDCTSRLTLQWRSDDLHYFNEVSMTRLRIQNALLDDLNGAICLDSLISLIDLGNNRIRNEDSRHEPIEAAIQLIRSTLRMLGFHKETYEAGLNAKAGNLEQSRKFMLDEFTKFRSTVRRAAISDHQASVASINMKLILEACDHLREKIFPSLGVELIDKSLRDGGGIDEWQYCVQQISAKTSEQSKAIHAKKKVYPDPDIDPTLLFQSGSFKGQFSEFDEAGIPTKLADGSIVSKSQTKKFRMIREKYERKYLERYKRVE